MLKLRVVEALQEDAYKGIVRVDPVLMKKLDLERGDIVSVLGERETFAIVDQAYPADHGEDIIRMDGITRKNSRTGIGDQVKVTKKEIIEAKKITIAPAQKGVVVKGNPDNFRRGLLGKPVNKGDIVVLGGAQSRRDIMSDDLSNLFGGDISEVFSQMGFGGMPGGLTQVRFAVASTKPNKPCIITENTEIILSPKALDISDESIPQTTYEDIGGLNEEVKKVREMVELPLKRPEIFTRLGIEPPKGVLLFGPPGTGKTLLAKAVANESEAHFILLNGPEIMSKFYGESEKKIRAIFEEAEKNSPAIIFIDEIDSLAPKREDVGGEVERRVVSQLLTMMDGLQDRGKVVVIGATNRLNAIDPALRRPGRFDREVEISAPDKLGRKQILQIHTRNMPIIAPIENKYIKDKLKSLKENLRGVKKSETAEKHEIKEIKNKIKNLQEILEELIKNKKLNNKAKEEEILEELIKNKKLNNKAKEEAKSACLQGLLRDIARKTHGFVGADINSLAKEAAMIVIRNNIHKLNPEGGSEISQEVLDSLRISGRDFNEALRVVRPSAMREVLVETPSTKWKDIGGVESVKQDLREAVEWPLKFSDAFTRMGITPPKGVLLYGPPGTGKTLLAKAVANESEANFIQIKGPSLLSMWVGKSEEGVRKIFERARQVSPCVVFFDEIDSLASKRGSSMQSGSKVTENVLNQLLAEMDGIEDLTNVIVIGATNRPDILDPALLRPGRFDRIVYVSVPDEKGRLEILKIHTENMPIDKKESMLKELVKETEGFTGADIESLAREAAMLALREKISAKKVKKEHFLKAMEKVLPSVSKSDQQRYKQMESKYLKSAKAALLPSSISYTG